MGWGENGVRWCGSVDLVFWEKISGYECKAEIDKWIGV